jgi:glycosyltransferase involved in cell wall biosynthesis
MKIVLIDTFDYSGGGASRAAYRLHEGLRRVGVESKLFVCYKGRHDPEVYAYEPNRAASSRLARRARQFRWSQEMKPYTKSIPFAHSFYLDDRSPFLADPLKQLPDADLIHVHWVAGFLDFGSFVRWLPKRMPLVWTIHDMSPMTGGCCYDLGCGRFSERCGACPQLGSRNPADPTRTAWERKQRHYSFLDPDRVRLVTPSHWMEQQVGRSPLLGRFPRSVIPYGLDLEVFQPRDRRVAREVLGLPSDAQVLLFNAFNTHEFRKGYHLVDDILSGMQPGRNIWLLSVGREDSSRSGRFNHVRFGAVENDRLLSFVYSAADVYLCPSLADNLPNTLLESVACGTPVAAFEVGGVPDVVRPGVTGLLAAAGDTNRLCQAALELLENRTKCLELSANCRRIAVAEYALDLQAQRFQKLYSTMGASTLTRP